MVEADELYMDGLWTGVYGFILDFADKRHSMAGIESLVLPSEGIPREQTGPLIRRLVEWH